MQAACPLMDNIIIEAKTIRELIVHKHRHLILRKVFDDENSTKDVKLEM